MRLLIIGCGYLGTHLAQIARRETGAVVAGFARNSTTIIAWKGQGYEMYEGDVERPDTLPQIKQFAPTHVVYCVAGGRAGGSALYRRIYFEGLNHVLAVFREDVKKPQVFFISSTSVYPQKDGQWVDETSFAEPENETAQVLRQAEQLLLTGYSQGTVLRVAGIYGVGRAVLAAKIINSPSLIVDDNPRRWLNLIRVEDIASAIVSLARHPLSVGATINLCDNEPVALGEYYSWIRAQFSLPPVQFAPVPDKPLNKRISTRKLRETFGFQPQYPDFRVGLADVIRDF
ncbi:MAG: NAD-dependent epimerase/dehydratase family protein [Verrucomicrobiota bacterium]|nr:NAD-dependent epimerase/dehydratase family protein [Verrucomicrobiota bacterium]